MWATEARRDPKETEESRVSGRRRTRRAFVFNQLPPGVGFRLFLPVRAWDTSNVSLCHVAQTLKCKEEARWGLQALSGPSLTYHPSSCLESKVVVGSSRVGFHKLNKGIEIRAREQVVPLCQLAFLFPFQVPLVLWDPRGL